MNEIAVLSIKDLKFKYHSREATALEDINFEVYKGELLLIAGASGCGKTTLSRCVNGLIPRSYHGDMSGTILVNGKDIQELTLVEISQTIGTLLQDPERQIVASKVYNEIAFGPENLGLPREEIIQRIDQVAKQLKIEYLLDWETFNLSGGEKQKVALAGLLVMQPSILLLDEPLASLDSASAVEALEVFKELAENGITVIIVEHRVEDVIRIQPNRLLYMDAGRVAYVGPINSLPPSIDYKKVKLPAEWIMSLIEPIPLTESRSISNSNEPMVEFQSVNFRYSPDSRQVLRNVNLTINKGDLIALLGPNGSGKSTLIKHAIGLLKPTSGEVIINGKNTKEVSIAKIARTIGYVFQSPTHMLFAESVTKELEFGPLNLGYTPEEIQENVAKSIEIMNLTGLEEFPPLGLSFGQQKRTTIASVLAMRSRIFIMDEPTAGQDYYNYTRFMESLWNKDPSARSIISENFDASMIITHDVDLAINFANRVIIFEKGTIAADGTPDEVLSDLDLLDRCRVVPSSLLNLNSKYFQKTHRILPLPELIGLTK